MLPLGWDDLTDREEYQIKRKRLRLTLREVAKEMGVHLSYISKWESGTYTPPTNKVINKYKKYLDNLNKK